MTGNQVRNIRCTKLTKRNKNGFGVYFSQSDLAKAIGRGYPVIMRAELCGDKQIPADTEKRLREYFKSIKLKV